MPGGCTETAAVSELRLLDCAWNPVAPQPTTLLIAGDEGFSVYVGCRILKRAGIEQLVLLGLRA